LLAAVLKGIEDKLVVPLNADFNVETLTKEELLNRNISAVPLSFEKCMEILKTSKFLEEALGPEMVQVLIQRDEELLNASL